MYIRVRKYFATIQPTHDSMYLLFYIYGTKTTYSIIFPTILYV